MDRYDKHKDSGVEWIGEKYRTALISEVVTDKIKVTQEAAS